MTPSDGLARGDVVERLIFASSDAAAIEHAVDEHCQRALGAEVARVLFRRTSVGVTFGLLLDDGSRVVVKAHQPRQPVAFLEEVVDVQRRLAAAGFPCPLPLAPPARIGDGFATIETLVDNGDFRDAHEPAIRRELARLLARLLAQTETLEPAPALRRTWSLWQAEGLWPDSAHNPIFDFAATRRGAEWIDAFAAAAKDGHERDAPELVVHSDWSGKHFRFDDRGRVAVVYDWDSLAVMTEARAVGIAAATHTSNVELQVDGAPSPEEVAAFVDEYAAARPAGLDERIRRATIASAAYVVAYTARCEHALRVHGDFTAALARHRLSAVVRATAPCGR